MELKKLKELWDLLENDPLKQKYYCLLERDTLQELLEYIDYLETKPDG